MKLCNLLYVWTDLEQNFSDTYLIYFIDCCYSTVSWNRIDIWCGLFGVMEWIGRTDWSGTNCRVSYCDGIVVTVLCTHVYFLCQREINKENPAGGGINDLFERYCKDI